MSLAVRTVKLALWVLWLSGGTCGWLFSRAGAEEAYPHPINTSVDSARVEPAAPPAPKRPPQAHPLKTYPPLPSDPIFAIESRWREADAQGLLAGDPNAETAIAQGLKRDDWQLPREEPGPKPAPPLAEPGSSDPEAGRFIVKGDELDDAGGAHVAMAGGISKPALHDDASVRPAGKAAITTVVLADPEAVRRVADADAAELSPRVPKSAPALPDLANSFADIAVHTAPEAAAPQLGGVPEAAPRIAGGSALDNDEISPIAPIVPITPGAPAAPVAPAMAAMRQHITDALQGTVDDSNPLLDQRRALMTASAAPAAMAAPASPPAKAAVRSEGNDKHHSAVPDAKLTAQQQDPQKEFELLLKEIAKQRETLRVLMGAEKAKQEETYKERTGQEIHGDHQVKAMNSLTDKRRLGAVTVRVMDPATKQYVNALVKLVDSTETTARAPLEDGFWCRGLAPAIAVVPGLVRAEVHRSRFFPTYIEGLKVQAGMITPLDVPLGHSSELDFEKRGWYLADLDIGLAKTAGEQSVWFGSRPTIQDLILGAKTGGVRVVGVELPLGDEQSLNELRAVLANPNPDVVVLPVFPGPRNAFNGSGLGLGVQSWDGLHAESALPDMPLYEAFDAIRARGGLAVFKDLGGLRSASIENEILPVFQRLKNSGYFNGASGPVSLFGANELPFDTVTNAYDVMAFDGSDSAEAVWFNLLNEGAPVRVVGAGGGSLEGGRIPYGQTFLKTDGPPTRESVLDAVRAGRTGVSYGPAAFCKVFERDMGPGSVLPTDGRPLTLQIQAYSTLAPGAQLDKVEIIRNGVVVHTQEAGDGEAEIHDMRYPFSEVNTAWYVVRVTERINAVTGAADGGGKARRAWTSPIYFRGAAFAPSKEALSHVHGVLRRELTPVAGVVTALAAGMPTQRIETAADGSYSVTLPASGTLIFEAQDCEPLAKHIFEHPNVQRAMGKQLASNEIVRRLTERPIFNLWRLTLSDLEWDVSLPMAPRALRAPDSPKLPEPQ